MQLRYFFSYDCALVGDLFTAFVLVRAHLSVLVTAGLRGHLFVRVHFLVLGHGLGSVASFICALWHLSQLTAVHISRVGHGVGRVRLIYWSRSE